MVYSNPSAVRLHCMQIVPYICHRDHEAVVFQRAIQGSPVTVGIYPVNNSSITLSGQRDESHRRIDSNRPRQHQASTSVFEASQRARITAGESEMAERQPHLTPQKGELHGLVRPASRLIDVPTAGPDSPDITPVHRSARPRCFAVTTFFRHQWSSKDFLGKPSWSNSLGRHATVLPARTCISTCGSANGTPKGSAERLQNHKRERQIQR